MLLAGEKGYTKSSDYMQNLATAYLQSGNFDKGIEMMKETLQKRPGDAGILNLIARSYYNSKRYNDAITYYNKVIEQDGKDANAIYMSGLSYLKKGDKAKGEAICNKAIELNPGLQRYRQKQEAPF